MTMKAREILGNNIHYYRKKMGLTQKELAKLTGFNRVYICYIENGKKNTTLNLVDKFSEKMGVPVAELLKEREWTD